MHSWHNFTGGGGGRVNPLMGRKSLLKKKMKKKKKKKKKKKNKKPNTENSPSPLGYERVR